MSYDLAFGGAFYAFVDADALGLPITPAGGGALIDAGRRITRAVSVAAAAEIAHPDDPDLGFLYGTVFTGAPRPIRRVTRATRASSRTESSTAARPEPRSAGASPSSAPAGTWRRTRRS